MKGYIYILKSQKNNRYYIGSTTDWKRRVDEHNTGKSTYTRATRPWVVEYVREYQTIVDARREEIRLKRKKSRKNIEELIDSVGAHSSVG